MNIASDGKIFDPTSEPLSKLLEGIHVFRHPLPYEADGMAGYALEYGWALFWEFVLSVRAHFKVGFDCVQACNPPDLIFIIGAFWKFLFGKPFLFDHHDINPELYEAKFGRRGMFHRLLLKLERWTFATADASIATNETFKAIAVDRGGPAEILEDGQTGWLVPPDDAGGLAEAIIEAVTFDPAPLLDAMLPLVGGLDAELTDVAGIYLVGGAAVLGGDQPDQGQSDAPAAGDIRNTGMPRWLFAGATASSARPRTRGCPSRRNCATARATRDRRAPRRRPVRTGSPGRRPG